MGSVYRRKDSSKLWWRYKGPDGRNVTKASPFPVGEEAAARQALERIELSIRQRVAASPERSTIPSVEKYAKAWIKLRRDRGIRDVDNDESRFRFHILPTLGSYPLPAVTRPMVKQLLAKLRAAGLAPGTIRNVHSNLKVMFDDAIDDELIETNPANVHARHLGRAGDKDPEWRQGAMYSRDEVVRLLTDTELPIDRRVIYAIAALSGLREGEIAGLRWRHIDDAEPLPRMLVAHSYDSLSKTDQPRSVPVHPVLARVLTDWRRTHYAELIGHVPGADDLIVPSPISRGGNGAHKHRPAGTMRTKNQIGKRFTRDLKLLGIPHRRFHDLRRTFISLAQADGARRDHLQKTTHTAGARQAFDLYTTLPWPTLCAAVAAFKPVPEAEEPAFARAITAPQTPAELRSSYGTKKARVSAGLKVEAPGVEDTTGRAENINDDATLARMSGRDFGPHSGPNHGGRLSGSGVRSSMRTETQTLFAAALERCRPGRATHATRSSRSRGSARRPMATPRASGTPRSQRPYGARTDLDQAASGEPNTDRTAPPATANGGYRLSLASWATPQRYSWLPNAS